MAKRKLNLVPSSFTKLFVLLLSLEFAMAGTTIKFLPGFQGPLPFEFETGYIGVGESEEVQLFYYFVKSESNPKLDPLILWMTGGPGCSSFTALAYEFGPIMFEDVEESGRLPRLVLNPNSWTEVASFIFLDTPAGTGFSYATNPEALKSNTMSACNEVHEFIRKFLIQHPEFISNPFYVGGDSFSGLIVPIVTELISKGNENGAQPPIDLKGYLLGNPVTVPTDNNYQVPFVHGMGILSDELYESLKTNCKENYQDIDPSNLQCADDLKAFYPLLRHLSIANILEPSCPSPMSKDMNSDGSLEKGFLELKRPKKMWCRDEGYYFSHTWSNADAVRDALQIRKVLSMPFTTTVRDCVPYHANLSKKGYRSLIYRFEVDSIFLTVNSTSVFGDHDLIVPFLATEAWIKSLNYPIIDDWRQWCVEVQVAGYTRKYAHQMTYATVKARRLLMVLTLGGGHTAPEYRPVECKAMFKRWISIDAL
ncbi:OLC1v1016347C1 [Oldenlandia corymbosa var. corymbosa]|uniref:OLC1v1016347C1 n=1 Tax=Oldenlandia corymbosa var. corymbosa TaxID=529605 RepID=A0AAV1E5G7_OLDCO|nr:OLC1v1016347C1 [Oldenlandia corymbosa var. corymbosa]